MKIGLAVGHSRKGDEGAMTSRESGYSISEWQFNCDLVRRILPSLQVDYVIYDDYVARSYVGGINYLSRKLTEDKVDAVIEFHFNSAGPKAEGHEWLYWHTSKEGARLAYALRDEMQITYPEMKSRGAKPRAKNQRGSYALRKTPVPCVLAEPFFGSNCDEWQKINNNRGKLAGVFARAINKFADG
mgnify:FL=1